GLRKINVTTARDRKATTQRMDRAFLLQRLRQARHQHISRLRTICRNELLPLVFLCLLKPTHQVLGIQRMLNVVAGSRANQPALSLQLLNDVGLKMLLVVSGAIHAASRTSILPVTAAVI